MDPAATCRATRSFAKFAAYVAMFPQLIACRISVSLPRARSGARPAAEGEPAIFESLSKRDPDLPVWPVQEDGDCRPLARSSIRCCRAYRALQRRRMGWPCSGTRSSLFRFLRLLGHGPRARPMLGFRFPLELPQPVPGAQPARLWRRWHISCRRWLRDYLYIPLGGNRRGRCGRCQPAASP